MLVMLRSLYFSLYIYFIYIITESVSRPCTETLIHTYTLDIMQILVGHYRNDSSERAYSIVSKHPAASSITESMALAAIYSDCRLIAVSK